MLRLAGASEEDDIEELVFVVTSEVEKQLDLGNEANSLEGIASLVNLESQVPQAEKGVYTQALLRLLLPETLIRVARLVTQSKQARYAVAVLHRAGSVGTDALFEQMVKAPSVEEMDAYGAALPAVKDGVKNLVDSLDSQDSTIVSIAIDQLSKLRVTEVATALGTLAINHPKKVIRQDACRGLLQMQGDDKVMGPIRLILESKSAVLFGRCVQRGVSDQVVGLISAAAITTEDIVGRKELCRSLGRAGSTRAIQQLVKISLPGGRFFGRKPLDSRLAAIEGLGLVEGPLAHGTLQDLTADRNPAIRAAASKMLERPEERPAT
jgi:HEAT repeat protein